MERADSWGNVVTGLGITTRDKRMGAVVMPPEELSQRALEDLFAGDPVARRICELPARESVRQWISISADKDVGKATLQALQVLGVQSAISEALTWARLYGGSVILLGVDDGQDPSLPLREDSVKSFRWINVLHRWELQVARRYTDPFAPKYREPETYRIVSSIVGPDGSGFGREVHETRLIRFDGPLTAQIRREQNDTWCDSVFTHLSAVIRDFWTGFDGAAHLLSDFSQAVYKVKGLAGLVSAKPDALIRRFQIMDTVRSLVRAAVIDADGEDFERKATPISGMPELLDRMEKLLSASTGIPVTLLMGSSPAGLQATGASDIRFFYDTVASDQETVLRPRIERLLTLLLRAKDGPTKGREPANWSFKFNPLWQLSAKEQAEIRKLTAETDTIEINAGVLHPEEVRQSRYGGDEYSTVTTLDESLDAADRIPTAPEEPEEGEDDTAPGAEPPPNNAKDEDGDEESEDGAAGEP